MIFTKPSIYFTNLIFRKTVGLINQWVSHASCWQACLSHNHFRKVASRWEIDFHIFLFFTIVPRILVYYLKKKIRNFSIVTTRYGSFFLRIQVVSARYSYYFVIEFRDLFLINQVQVNEDASNKKTIKHNKHICHTVNLCPQMQQNLKRNH